MDENQRRQKQDELKNFEARERNGEQLSDQERTNYDLLKKELAPQDSNIQPDANKEYAETANKQNVRPTK